MIGHSDHPRLLATSTPPRLAIRSGRQHRVGARSGGGSGGPTRFAAVGASSGRGVADPVPFAAVGANSGRGVADPVPFAAVGASSGRGVADPVPFAAVGVGYHSRDVSHVPAPHVTRSPLRVAILGAGTVGREVAAALISGNERLHPHDAPGLELVGLAVRNVARAASAGLPAYLLTDAPAHLVASPDVDVIVELMGGDEPAHTLIAAALGAGKPVITANKHVVAHHGPELEAIARRSGTPFRFEAAVCAGLPILGPLSTDLAANRFTQIRGIVNGTTNYILTAMADEGREYAEALKAAQSAGYAEADPTGDVEGDDARNKLVILVRLAFGRWLAPEAIARRPPTLRGNGAPGITGIRATDIAGARAFGLTMKLLATATTSASATAEGAEGTGGSGRIRAAIIPAAIHADTALGRTSGVLNRVELDGEPVGQVAISGPGAGGKPTSSAVLGDLLAVATGKGSTWASLPPAGRPADSDLSRPAFGPETEGEWLVTLDGAPAFDPSALPAETRCHDVNGGTALLVGRSALATVRRALEPCLPSDRDVTIYPVSRPTEFG